jgi:hypothetical protein
VLKSDVSGGVLFIDVERFSRVEVTKSYSFTSTSVGSGVFYSGGFYDWAASDANLTQAVSSIAYGSANSPHSSHPGIVPSGPGTVNTGQVGFRVTGVAINDDGILTPGTTEILTDDITTLSANTYYEVGKFVGNVTFELYVVSGSPTTYSLDFNYGLSKYEDVGNSDFTVVGFEALGLAGANDSTFNIEVLKHVPQGWTYAATGFVPGNGAIATFQTDIAPYDNLVNGRPFAWKRTNLNTFVDGSGEEGVVFRITTGTNNAVKYMNLHLAVVLE